MTGERFDDEEYGHRYVRMTPEPPEPEGPASSASFRLPKSAWVFDGLPGARIVRIGMIIEDKEVVSSTMDGRPWEAGKFSLSLRLSLWAEHLGLLPGEVSCIMDPVDDSAYKNIWMATAKENTMIYQQVFSCVPNDHIHSRYQFRQSFAHRKEKIGHTTIDSSKRENWPHNH